MNCSDLIKYESYSFSSKLDMRSMKPFWTYTAEFEGIFFF